jgi:hypothetical protein
MKGVIYYNTLSIPKFEAPLELSKCHNNLFNCLIKTPYDIIIIGNNLEFILTKGTHFIPNTHVYNNLSLKTNYKNIEIYNECFVENMFTCDMSHYVIIFTNILNINKFYMTNYNGIIDYINYISLYNLKKNNNKQYLKYEKIIANSYYKPIKNNINSNISIKSITQIHIDINIDIDNYNNKIINYEKKGYFIFMKLLIDNYNKIYLNEKRIF